ncbi:ABC transporter permease [Dongia rigui]|uniref:ABC transporter permease subunit n=1 Tax=Dongia rigui TaxID=940149 RepID=A0ABU5DVF5_9PROT|nr:ABC transporter permease subunit [Dongia rigui]MDY0871270.1 ABC transporter permease subunit [Dongia rigui]
MKFDPIYMFTVVMPQLIWALPLTLLLTISSSVIGNICAVPVALARLSPNPLLWIPARTFIFMMRGTPFLIQLYFIYYGLGQLIPGWMMRGYPFLKDGIYYAIFALSLNTAGYTGEILRGAILAVPHGEIEAARAFGMNRFQVFWRITLPRAVRICLPTMSSETILLLKATSIASLVTVYEVMGTATTIRVDTYRVYDTLIGAGIVYFVTVYFLTRGLNWVERRLNKDRLAIPVSGKPLSAQA